MAWDFAAEIHSLTSYDADDASTTGTSGEVLSAHVNQWLNDGAKEVIMQLPSSLQEKCSDFTLVTDGTALDLDTATVGKVLYCTRKNDSNIELPCRLVSASNASLVDDSTASNYYATEDDPAYFIRDNKAEIKPTPDGQGAKFYHIVYPSALTYDDNSIANFPNEAEYLVVLYAAQKALQYLMTVMTASFNSDITTALTAVNTAADDVKAEIVLANAEVDLEDIEKATGYLNTAQAYIAEAGVYVSEVTSRLGKDVTKYGWYVDQHAKLQAQYLSGLAILKGA